MIAKNIRIAIKRDSRSTRPRCPFGAGDRNRTRNLLITNQLHCQLCYTSTFRCGASRSESIIPYSTKVCQCGLQGAEILKRELLRAQAGVQPGILQRRKHLRFGQGQAIGDGVGRRFAPL